MATGSFAIQMRRFAEKAGKNMDLVVRHTTISIANSVVERSPVGNPDLWKSPPPPGYVGGRFRANWMFGVGAPDNSTTENTDKDGGPTLNRLSAAIGATGAGGVTYISNSLPYGPAIEDGHSTQAPTGVVEITAIEFQDYVRQAVAELDK